MDVIIFLAVSIFAFFRGLNYFRLRNYQKALLYLIFLFLDGFDIVPAPGGSLIYSNVGILLMFVMLYVAHNNGSINFFQDKLCRRFTWFGLYLIVCSVFSVVHYNFEPFEVFRVVKWILPFWSVYLYKLLSKYEADELIYTLTKITVLLNVVYIIQSVIDVPLLATDKTSGVLMGGFHRYYNKPILSDFILLYLLYNRDFIKGRMYLIYTLTLSFALIISFNRTEIFAVVIGYIIIMMLKPGVTDKIKKIVLIGIFLMPIMWVSQLRDQTDPSGVSSVEDINYLINGGYEHFTMDSWSDGGTMTFRFAMMYERIDYMLKCNPLEILFGLGLGHTDYSGVYNRYNFQIGTLTGLKENGPMFSQLESADFAWVSILCQWGVLGMFIFCSLFYLFSKSFYDRRSNSLSLVTFGYMLVLLIISFAGKQFVMATYYLVPMICYFRQLPERDNFRLN